MRAERAVFALGVAAGLAAIGAAGASGWLLPAPERVAITAGIEPRRGAVLTGRVVGEGGAPVAGARVVPIALAERAEYMPVRDDELLAHLSGPDAGPDLSGAHLRTGADGRFAIRVTRRGRYGLDVSAAGWATAAAESTTDGDGVDIQLERAATIRGVVIGRGGPLAGVQIAACPDAESVCITRGAVTAADGRFVLEDLPARDHELSLTPDGYFPESLVVSPGDSERRLVLKPAGAVDLAIEVPRHHCVRDRASRLVQYKIDPLRTAVNVDLELERRERDGWRLFRWHWISPRPFARWCDDGPIRHRFERLDDGVYRVRAQFSGIEQTSAPIAVRDAEVAALPMQIPTVVSSRISGVVHAPPLLPFDAVEVCLAGPRQDASRCVEPDSAGRFSFEAVKLESATIRAIGVIDRWPSNTTPRRTLTGEVAIEPRGRSVDGVEVFLDTARDIPESICRSG